ncbi:LCP family protein [Patescibacteria group bacterium]|nr:LCP family protein [Patescibacteria group bacterium]MBU1563644.1 LCP family protein [Patescibacteria group bacterium]MBU2068077.1 LCP family protein [Patescibacteria group bacterium]
MVQIKKKFCLIILVLFIVGFFSIFLFKTSFTISRVIDWTRANDILPFSKKLPDLPENDPDRINILLLGGRGLEESGDGKLLSDAMILTSIKKSTGQVAMISLPRDLYVTIYCTQEDKKINFAYAQGGLDCAKKTVSLITGQYVDYAVDVNFEALVEGIDALGGIEVYLEKAFEENFQWSKEGWEENEHWFIKEINGEERWVFYVATGTNQLDGQTALYYVRSRYSTDDFDRMRRQSQVLIAIKEKAFSLGVLTNPVKIYNLLDVLGKNIRTDMKLTDISSLIGLIGNIDKDNIKRRFFDITPNGLLYHTFINEEYVLLPVGDNFDKIQEACHNIFD